MTKPSRVRRKPYVRSADAPPLREVVVQLAAKTRQLNSLDDEIGRKLGAIEDTICKRRPHGHPVDVPFPPWGKLGWSGRRGRWRLVVVDEDECEDLSAMPRECRAEACSVLGKLVERLDLRQHKETYGDAKFQRTATGACPKPPRETVVLRKSPKSR